MNRNSHLRLNGVTCDWAGSAVHQETTLHQLSPYIGKIKSTMANALVRHCTRAGNCVYDPFAGCGTIALESWIAGRNVIANDLSPYASLLTRAKLFPLISQDDALHRLQRAAEAAVRTMPSIDLSVVPKWIRAFFHRKTLQEILAWRAVLARRSERFLLACLLGILHHQRPGFLSFPSSHAVPYLRLSRFPVDVFPELYRYRAVAGRLEAKVGRALKRIPNVDFSIQRQCFLRNAELFRPADPVDAIITSPPYMRQLDYGRDNRMRLWFLGVDDPDELDAQVSPTETQFFELMRKCLTLWRQILKPGGRCVLVVGDVLSTAYGEPLAHALAQIAVNEIGGYQVRATYKDTIPTARRVRRACRGSTSETILIMTTKR